MYNSNFKIKSDPVILGLESSCDETAAAVIRGRTLLSSKIISSATEQAKYGGVVPEIASRAHTEAVDEVVSLALSEAGVTLNEIDAVAVTYGAGLFGRAFSRAVVREIVCVYPERSAYRGQPYPRAYGGGVPR